MHSLNDPRLDRHKDAAPDTNWILTFSLIIGIILAIRWWIGGM